tara:strand:+ start:40 stop:243 length:204 start_codon:yes stop_codon:yes gene_type:complete
MANIEDWYGRNSIGWGESYDSSWFGNVNETNSWGIIYPFNVDGSFILADTNLINADSTQYKADATQF